MTKEELKNKCKERAKIFQQAMESCKSSNPIDCIEWFADRIAELEKANEWHYVKDGDLPSDRHGHVVINQDWDKVTIRNGRFEHLDGGKADVIAWKEIVLPELPKESE